MERRLAALLEDYTSEVLGVCKLNPSVACRLEVSLAAYTWEAREVYKSNLWVGCRQEVSPVEYKRALRAECRLVVLAEYTLEVLAECRPEVSEECRPEVWAGCRPEVWEAYNPEASNFRSVGACSLHQEVCIHRLRHPFWKKKSLVQARKFFRRYCV